MGHQNGEANETLQTLQTLQTRGMRGITHYIEIQRRQPLVTGGDDNDFAEVDRPFEKYKHAYATVTPLNGRELLNAQEVHNEATYKLTLRHQPGITSAMRVAYGSRTLEITGVIPSAETSRDMLLYCKEANLAS